MQIFSLIIFIIKVDTLCADAISYERGPKRDLTGSPLIHLLNVCRLQDYHHFGTPVPPCPRPRPSTCKKLQCKGVPARVSAFSEVHSVLQERVRLKTVTNQDA